VQLFAQPFTPLPSDKAMIAARLRPFYEAQAKERQEAALKQGNKTKHGDKSSIPEKIPESRKSRDSRDEAGKAADFLTAETGAWSKPRPTTPAMTTNSGRKSKTNFTSENIVGGLPASPSQTASA
jgi:hypothetical protein